jgi:2'-5' RNA ligase
MKHDYSNTQVQIPQHLASAIQKIGKLIPDNELTEDGREKDSHVTVKYGISDEKPSRELREALAGFGAIKAKFGKTSLFENDDADVVKLDIESPGLHRLSKLIGKTVETPGNTHPTYIPHATVAYVKPGKGKKYKGDAAMDGKEFTIDSVLFSGKNGTKENISLVRKSKFGRYGL